MKKITAVLIISVFLAAILGCHEPDNTPPEIILLGADYFELPLDSSFEEPGFNAWDDEDGDLADHVLVTNQVDFNKTGTYKIYYTVTDKSGNTDETYREIKIYNEARGFAGHCDATITPNDGGQVITYQEVLEVSETENHHLIATRFMDDSIKLEMIVNGTVEIPQQQIVYQSDTFSLYQQVAGSTGTLSGAPYISSTFFLVKVNTGQPAKEYYLQFDDINPL